MNSVYATLPNYVHYFKIDDHYCALLNAISLDTIFVRTSLLNVSGKTAQFAPSLRQILAINNYLASPQEVEENIQSSINSAHKKTLDNSIKFLYIVPTTECNLTCTYCHIQHAKQQHTSNEMTYQTLHQGLEMFKKYGGFDTDGSEIMFYGGEPFLKSDFIFYALKTIREYSKNIRITIFTNGTLINSEIAAELLHYNVYVIVSLDGIRAVNNQARVYANGSGSYDDAVNGYWELAKHNIPVGISLVAGTHNIRTLDEDISVLSEMLKPLDIGISTLHLFPDAPNPNDIPIEEISYKLRKVQSNMRERGLYIEHIFRRLRPFVEQSKRIYDCPSCNTKLLITPWGTVGPCEAFMETEMFFNPLDSFDLEKCDGREKWKNRVPLTMQECYSCPAISICGGGCPYDAFCETGDICRKDSRRCTQSTLMISWLVEDLLGLLKEKRIISNQDYYIPSRQDRELLYGNVKIYDSIPLQRYSNSNESAIE